jgi:hypothetical protein
MQTHSEILCEETRRMERAIAYERLTGNIATLKRELKRLEPQLQAYESELALITKIFTLSRDISPKTVGYGGVLARESFRLSLGAAEAFNIAQRDKVQSKIKVITSQLPRLEKQLEEFVAS